MQNKNLRSIICCTWIFFLFSHTLIYGKEISLKVDFPNESQLKNPQGMWWCNSRRIRTITIIRWGMEHPKEGGETRHGPGGIKVQCGKGETKILYCPENYGVSQIKKQKYGMFFIKCEPYL